MNEPIDQFGKKAKTVFDASVNELDAATLSKLNASRHKALEELTRTTRQWSRWAPATGVAAAALVAVMWLQSPTAVQDVTGPVNVTDMEILLGEDSIEMLEDLEFYSWINVVELESDVG